MFVGVPTSVVTPPMLAAYAIPNRTAVDSFSRAFVPSPLAGAGEDCTWTRFAGFAERIHSSDIAIGSITSVVAVLLIHIDSKNVATQNPSTIRFGTGTEQADRDQGRSADAGPISRCPAR